MDWITETFPQLADLVAWMQRHDVALSWIAGSSAILAVAMLVLTPWLVSIIPDDYFATKERPPIVGRSEHPVLRWTLRIAKNLLGLTLIIIGLFLTLLPGQGMITALGGLLLLDFPGKRRLEMWVIRRRGLLKAINWFRARRNTPPLVVWSPEDEDEVASAASAEREAVRR
jgi:hypothetical protein